MNLRPLIKQIILVGCLQGVLHAYALAIQNCPQTPSVPMAIPGQTFFVPIDRYDPAQGPLGAVTLEVLATYSGSVGIENIGNSPIGMGMLWGVNVELRPSTGTLVLAAVEFTSFYWMSLQAYDGSLDFGGPSGGAFNFGPVTHPRNVTLTDPQVLAEFTGLAGNPGQAQLRILTGSQAHEQGGNGNQFTYFFHQVGVPQIRVCYHPAATGSVLSVCDARGNASAPCGEGATANGAPNSTNTAGARLVGQGMPSVVADGLILVGSGMTPTSACMYIQGTSLNNHGQGVPFGDGILCLSGSIIRLGTKVNTAGSSVYPEGVDPSVSVRGLVAGGGSVRHYQCWYRDVSTFCTASTFNLTNAVTVVWAP